MRHLLHYQLLHDSAPLQPLTATYPPISCSRHPARRTRGETKSLHRLCDVGISAFCNLCMMARWLCYWPGITYAYALPDLPSVIGVFSIPPRAVKKLSAFLQDSLVFLCFMPPKGDQTPRCPHFPIKIHVTVTFSSARAWFISSTYGAAFLFFDGLMVWFLECM